jgi:integrase
VASVFRPTYTKADPATGGRVSRQSRKWWVKYRDADGVVRRKSGFTDKAATVQLARNLERQVARQAVGLVDEFAEHRQKPLADHLADFERSLAAKGNTPRHVTLVVRRVQRLLRDCRMAYVQDLRGSAIAEMLGCYQRAGLSPQTRNSYLSFIKGFCRWLVRERRIPDSPLAHLATVNVRTDRRHDRASLSADAVMRLLAATRTGRPFRGLSGADRALLYETALLTGLRVAELASLTSSSFDFESDPPTVSVEAGYSKHRRRDVLPLHPELVAELRMRAAAQGPGVPLWIGTWSQRASRMVRSDLERAGLPYRDQHGRFFDFHALRHTFLSNLARSGVHPKLAQGLARHSSIELTMNAYTHVDLDDLNRGLRLVPGLSDQSPRLVPQLVPAGGAAGRQASLDGKGGEDEVESSSAPNPKPETALALVGAPRR